MKRTAALLGALALLSSGLPRAHAIVVISSDFPTGQVSGAQISDKEQLSRLVALYQNDVALLVNPDANYSETIKTTKSDPAIEDQLRSRATADGGKLTMDSLAAAVTAMVNADPKNAHVITASALPLLAELGGPSAENRTAIGKAALAGIPASDNSAGYAALVVGVAANGLDYRDIAKTVADLRTAAISDTPQSQLIDTTVAVDQALIGEGILTAAVATPEFVTLARAFRGVNGAPDTGADAGNFSGDQGTINQGATGGFGGSGGGGSSNDNPTPTPTPVPTPTPSPTPVS